MIAELVLLLIGLLGLWLGSVLAIKGARNIAAHFAISSGFVGLTILSIGTSVPEIAVSIAGGIDRLHGMETSGIVIGNKIGSAANQLTLILGLVALFGILAVRRRILFREGIMLIGSVLLLGFMGLDGYYSVFEGWVLIVIYLLYLLDLTRQERLHKKLRKKPELHLAWDALSLVGGLFLVAITSDFVIRSGISLAEAWGVTQTFIGIFIVGLGTGLPELAVSLAAIRKKEVEMSVGNLIGSNICDLLFSLGAGTVIAGFLMPRVVLLYDLPALLVICLSVLFLFRSGMKLTKREGIVLIAMFFAYLGLRLYLFG